MIANITLTITNTYLLGQARQGATLTTKNKINYFFYFCIIQISCKN
jgi:hypothetical protein